LVGNNLSDAKTAFHDKTVSQSNIGRRNYSHSCVDGLGFLLLVTAVLDGTAGHPSMWGRLLAIVARRTKRRRRKKKQS
jgi:hypothetical protein